MSDRNSKRSQADSANNGSSKGSISKVAAQRTHHNHGHPGISSRDPTSPMLPRPGQAFNPPQGKMLLPPLARPTSQAGPMKPAEKNRTAHACDKCRKAKAKCSGGQPCDKCQNEGKTCVYGDGKRDSEKKAMQHLNKEKQRLIKYNDKLKEKLEFLCQTENDNKPSDQDIVDARALVYNYKDSDYYSEEFDDGESPQKAGSEGQHGEDFAGAEVGSTGSVDNIREDTNRDERARATGYIGKSSAVTWVQRAKKQSEVEDSDGPSKIPNKYIDSNYLAQEADFPSIDEDGVNPFELPAPFLARALIECYFENVHGCFPVLCKVDFMNEYNEWARNPAIDAITEKQQTWLCLLNLIFAISSRFPHVMGQQWGGAEQDHLIYVARSRKLGMDSRTLHQDPELDHTVNLCLFGMYCLSTDQISKSWIVTGIAIRYALALGLHMRSLTDDLTSGQKESRVRLWWSLYSLERVLDEILGRPSAISDQDIGTPLPSNLNDEDISEDRVWPDEKHLGRDTNTRRSPTKSKPKATASEPAISALLSPANTLASSGSTPLSSAFTFPLVRLPITSSTLFIYRVQLSVIAHEITSTLYCATTVQLKWNRIQEIMRKIDGRLKDWKAYLPREYDFTTPDADDRDDYGNDRAGLEMFYNATRMSLFRPCLCKFDGGIKGESNKSKSFNGKAINSCISAARAVIHAIPSDDPQGIHSLVPWWSTAHHVIQAASILMLELAHRAEHVPELSARLVSDSKKAIHYLSVMSGQSVSARKGWEILDGLLRIVAPKVGIDVSDMSTTAPLPYGWRYAHYGDGSYLEKPESLSQNDTGGQYALSTSAWVDQISHGSVHPYSPADAMAPIYAAGPGAQIQQYFGGSLPSFNLAGPNMGLHDEFDPWQAALYNCGTNYWTSVGVADTIPASTSMAMEGLEITQPRSDARFGHGTSVAPF